MACCAGNAAWHTVSPAVWRAVQLAGGCHVAVVVVALLQPLFGAYYGNSLEPGQL